MIFCAIQKKIERVHKLHEFDECNLLKDSISLPVRSPSPLFMLYIVFSFIKNPLTILTKFSCIQFFLTRYNVINFLFYDPIKTYVTLRNRVFFHYPFNSCTHINYPFNSCTHIKRLLSFGRILNGRVYCFKTCKSITYIIML